MARSCIAVLFAALALSVFTIFAIINSSSPLPQLKALRHLQDYVQEHEASAHKTQLARSVRATVPGKNVDKRASGTYLLGVGKADLTG